MEAIEKLIQMGYTVKAWSTWEGDAGKYMFCRGARHWLGQINTNTQTITPMHGFYGGILKGVSKQLGYTLNDPLA